VSYEIANYMEAGLWATFAVVVGCKGLRAQAARRWNLLLAAVALLAFGLSDIVEAGTGAWWRPWWLLVWKLTALLALCILIFAQPGKSRHGPSHAASGTPLWS
jgi:hypothetical protein